MKNDKTTLKTPEEKYEEAALELAVYRMLHEEGEHFDAQTDPAEKEKIERQATESLPEILSMIRHEEHKGNRNKHFAKFGRQFLKAAAAVLLMFYLGGTVAVASSKTVRGNMVRFFTQLDDSSLTAGFVPVENSNIDVPSQWQADYYPAYIPDNYNIKDYIGGTGTNIIILENSSGKELSFSVYDSTSISSYNVQNSNVSCITINGSVATVIEQPYGVTDIICNLGDAYYVVSSEEGYDTAVAVASSFVYLKN